jgi:transcriptional regulator with XRE-family HTH domain
MNNETIGRRIARVRKLRGLSQRDLAKLVRVDYGAIGNLESGRHATNMFIFIDIAKALDVSCDYLAYGGNYAIK